MIKNSTLKFWHSFLKNQNTKILSEKKYSKSSFEPNQETINAILSYASSVKGVKMKSGKKILISLN